MQYTTGFQPCQLSSVLVHFIFVGTAVWISEYLSIVVYVSSCKFVNNLTFSGSSSSFPTPYNPTGICQPYLQPQSVPVAPNGSTYQGITTFGTSMPLHTQTTPTLPSEGGIFLSLKLCISVHVSNVGQFWNVTWYSFYVWWRPTDSLGGGTVDPFVRPSVHLSHLACLLYIHI